MHSNPRVPARAVFSWSGRMAFQTDDGAPGLILPDLWDEEQLRALAADKKSYQDKFVLALENVTHYFNTPRDPSAPGFARMTATRNELERRLRLRVLVSKVSSDGLHTLCLGNDLRCIGAAGDGDPEWCFESASLPGCAENSLRLSEVNLNMGYLGPLIDPLFTGAADRCIECGAGWEHGDEYNSPREAVQVAEYLEGMAPWRVVT